MAKSLIESKSEDGVLHPEMEKLIRNLTGFAYGGE